MPIYAYRCTACGNAQDVLRKISDPPLAACPACGAATFVKQVTAAGFQLKGSGWYVTDFRDGKAGKPAAGEGDAGGAKNGEGAKDVAAGKTEEAGKAGAGTSTGDAKPTGEGAAKAAPTAAPAVAAAPAPAAPAAAPAPAPASGKTNR